MKKNINLQDILAVIPAKKRSTRLEHKNLKNFNNRPLIYYTIRFAQLSNLKHIVVSTDCVKIKSFAIKMGVCVIDRPSELCDDYAKTSDVIKHATTCYLKKNNIIINKVVTLQPTNPLRPKNLLSNTLKIMNDNNTDSILSVCINKRKFGTINHHFIPLNYSYGERSQDLKQIYYENGLIYISDLKLILKSKIISKKNSIIITDKITSIDIDDILDFKTAEYLFKFGYNTFNYLI